MALRFAIPVQVLGTADDAQLPGFDAAEGLEGRTGRPATLRAVAIERIAERILDFILDGAAQAAALQHGVHRPSPCGAALKGGSASALAENSANVAKRAA